MLETQVVRLEGVESPCILLSPSGEVPDELVINFKGTEHPEVPKAGPTTYRLEPSTAHDAVPVYRELFDE